MKRFKFKLENVLKYRVSTEKNEKSTLAGLNAELAAIERQRARLHDEYVTRAKEFESAASVGVTVHEIRSAHAFMKNIERGIEIKDREIEDQSKLVQEQTAVVVKAMQDTKVLDKLKEQRFKEHTAEERKAEERFVEEFVTNKIAASKS
jgi:flagellar FliJ protein